jgi:hypothetical protein
MPATLATAFGSVRSHERQGHIYDCWPQGADQDAARQGQGSGCSKLTLQKLADIDKQQFENLLN